MRCKAGFTLLEILVVVLIITVLASIVGVRVIPRLGKAKVAAAEAQIQNFRTALRLYKLDHGRYPTQEQGLDALCRRPAAVPVPEGYPPEGYLDGMQVPLDPWGNEYVYLEPGPFEEPYVVICYGADGEPGGTGNDDDITSTE